LQMYNYKVMVTAHGPAHVFRTSSGMSIDEYVDAIWRSVITEGVFSARLSNGARAIIPLTAVQLITVELDDGTN
jgi:hypothetical protein